MTFQYFKSNSIKILPKQLQQYCSNHLASSGLGQHGKSKVEKDVDLLGRSDQPDPGKQEGFIEFQINMSTAQICTYLISFKIHSHVQERKGQGSEEHRGAVQKGSLRAGRVASSS